MRRRGVMMKDKTFLMIPGPTPIPDSVMMEIADNIILISSATFSQTESQITKTME